MAKKILGYVEMEWTCPRCGVKNPGSRKTCAACGGPQPVDTKFQQREGQPLIEDEGAEKIAQARRTCIAVLRGAQSVGCKSLLQCGADLKAAQPDFRGGGRRLQQRADAD